MFFKKLSLVTGGFDPIHSGHISYFTRAKDFSDYLVVGINTEEWLTKKKGQYFQSWVERAEIIRHLDMVDAVITVPDDDKGSACGAIAKCLEISEKVIFCNGGDKCSVNTPEEKLCISNPYNLTSVYNVGGEKRQSSSDIIAKAVRKDGVSEI